MKHAKLTISTLIALSIFSVSNANADLIIENGSSSQTLTAPEVKNVVKSPTNTFVQPVNKTSVSSLPYQSKNVSEIGTRIISAPVNGWGNDIELAVVLKQIVPNGWKATTKNGIDLTKKISWKSDNQSWIEVFGKIADDNGFSATVNWNTKRIELSGGLNTTSSPVSVQTTTSEARNPFSGSSANSTPSKSAVRATFNDDSTNVSQFNSYSGQLWHMDKSKTLRGNIEDWAQKAGWTVSWDAPDYRIIASFDLTGDLVAPNGPLAQVIKSYENSEQPLVARILKGNKVIRIESRNYEQSTVVTSSVGEEYKTDN